MAAQEALGQLPRQAAEPVLAVEVGRGRQRASPRSRSADGDDGWRIGPDDPEEARHVPDALLEGHVAGHDGHRLHTPPGRPEREEEREGIVEAQVGVDEDGHRHGARRSSALRALSRPFLPGPSPLA
jgi:hypothetical protein